MAEDLSAWAGAVSSLIIGGAVYFGQQRYARWNAAMAIIAEFNSVEWLNLRARVQDVLFKHPDPDIFAMREWDNPTILKEDLDGIWALIAFYARLSVMIDGRFVARRPIFATFAEVFAWWYEYSLRYLPGLNDTSEIAHIRQLNRTFIREANARHKARAYREWRERGRIARKRLGLTCGDWKEE